MTRALAALLVVLATVCVADPLLKNAGTRLGPVITFDCSTDAGINCTRTAATGTANLRCTTATATEAGCVSAAAQTLGGNKTVRATVRAYDFGGTDGGPANFTDGLTMGATGTGLAFASFPACTAPMAGRILFDSTSLAYRVCRSLGWYPIGPRLVSEEVSSYFPGTVALLNLPFGMLTGPRVFFDAAGSASSWGLAAIQLQRAITLVPGVGAGNAVFHVYNLTDAANTLATVTVPCASAAGTVTSGSPISDSTIAFPGGLPKDFQLRLTTNGCGTLPTVNIIWGWLLTPPYN